MPIEIPEAARESYDRLSDEQKIQLEKTVEAVEKGGPASKDMFAGYSSIILAMTSSSELSLKIDIVKNAVYFLMLAGRANMIETILDYNKSITKNEMLEIYLSLIEKMEKTREVTNNLVSALEPPKEGK